MGGKSWPTQFRAGASDACTPPSSPPVNNPYKEQGVLLHWLRQPFELACESVARALPEFCSLTGGGAKFRLHRGQMTGNPVEIGDGCATVTGYELPRPLIRVGLGRRE